MQTIQGSITNVMKELGYADSESGACAGLSQMWVQAYLCNDEQTFSDRIELLRQPDFIERAKKLSNKITHIQPEIGKKNNTQLFTSEELKIREALIFLDGVQAYGKPHLLKEFVGSNFNQNDVLPISSFLNSIALDKQGGITSPYSDTFNFDDKKLSEYFSVLRIVLQEGKKLGWGKCAFTIAVSDHQIGLSYNPETDKWRISNLGGILQFENPLIGKRLTSFMISQYAEIPPEKIAYFIKMAFFTHGATIVNIRLYTTNSNPYIKQITKTFSNIKMDHLITKEMANKVDDDNVSLAILAVQSSDIETLRQLIKNGEDINRIFKNAGIRMTLLNLALMKGDMNIIKLLLENGANAKELNDNPDFPAFLQHSISTNILEILFKNGVDLSKTDSSGTNLLHYAALNNATDVIQYLADKKFNLNERAQDLKNYTATHFAALKGNVETIEVLAKNGAELNAPSFAGGELPIHTASAHGNISFMRSLINKGVNINQTDFSKNTVAHYAVKENANQALLPVKKVDPYANNQKNIIHFLSQMNVDLNAKNGDGYTPLHLAVLAGNTSAVDALMQHGVDINEALPNKIRPVFIAMNDKNWDMVVLYLLSPTKLNPIEITSLNQNREKLVEAFIQYVNTKTDNEQRRTLVLSVLHSENILGKILNTFKTTLGFSYSSYQHDGKQITHSMAKILDEFPVENKNDDASSNQPGSLKY